MDAKPSRTVANLLRNLKDPQMDPSGLLKAISLRSTFYTLKVPLHVGDENQIFPEPPFKTKPSIQRSGPTSWCGTSPKNSTWTTSIWSSWTYLVSLFMILTWGDLWAHSSRTDGTAAAANKLLQSHAELFRCLTINVRAPSPGLRTILSYQMEVSFWKTMKERSHPKYWIWKWRYKNDVFSP